MDLGQLPALVEPLISGKANYMKGNRFRDFAALQKVPIIRHLGNIAHGFLSKLATGYWNIFDPTNGYIAIQAGTLKQLPLENIDKTIYFETSMPAELYPPGAFVLDVPTPARYNDQPSNLRIHRILFEFPSRLLVTLLKRILLKYFLYDFSMAFIYIVIGVPLFLFGMIIGTIKWIHYASLGIQKPTGTIILPMLCVVLGIQFLISPVQIDLQSSPSALLSKPANLDV